MADKKPDYILVHANKIDIIEKLVNDKIIEWYKPYWAMLLTNQEWFIQPMTLPAVQYVTVEKVWPVASMWMIAGITNPVTVLWCSCSCGWWG